MDTLKDKPIAYNQRLFDSFNEYFTSSHILLAGWCSVTLLFFILAFNSSVNININIVRIICICLSVSVMVLAYRSFLLMNFKHKRLIIVTKNKQYRKIIKRGVTISYILSFTFFLTTILIFFSFAYGLKDLSKIHKKQFNVLK